MTTPGRKGRIGRRERIGICRSNMFKLIRQGDVRSVKVGRLRRVTPAALEDFVARLDGGQETA